ncbi:MAG: sulfurtransferase TusA family protein [Propionibacteriales bacterium]|nr:sulfurtransferase TusA family protein [Propionibacteriales bacterium]
MTEPAVLLDCRRLLCPRPVVELAKNLHRVAIGETIGVAADDVAARTDVPAWARMRGQQFLGTENAEDGVPVYLVRRLS